MRLARLVCVILMLLFIPTILFGAITAVYTPEPYIVLQVQPGPYTSDTVLGAKLGTLIATTTDGDKIHSPVWGTINEVWGGVTLTGPMSLVPNGPFIDNSTDIFYIMSVAYPEGYPGTPTIRRLQGTYEPIIQMSSYTVNVNPFRVELWLVNTHQTKPDATVVLRPASCFQLNAVYTLPADFNPIFSFITANDASTNVGTMMNVSGTPNSRGSYVSVNGQSGPNSTPIVDPTSYTDPNNPGSPGITYGDPPQMVSYSVSLINQSISFNLTDAIGAKRKDVNTMMITVSNGKSGVNYTQEVIFRDSSTSNDFRLLPEVSGPSPIAFSLFFDTTPVIKGTPVLWDTLQNGSNNTKTIRIGGIDEIAIQSLASGTYSDTISVEIRNP